jgi:hypothetical protein
MSFPQSSWMCMPDRRDPRWDMPAANSPCNFSQAHPGTTGWFGSLRLFHGGAEQSTQLCGCGLGRRRKWPGLGSRRRQRNGKDSTRKGKREKEDVDSLPLGPLRQAFLTRIYELPTGHLSGFINRYGVPAFGSEQHVYPTVLAEDFIGNKRVLEEEQSSSSDRNRPYIRKRKKEI